MSKKDFWSNVAAFIAGAAGAFQAIGAAIERYLNNNPNVSVNWELLGLFVAVSIIGWATGKSSDLKGSAQ